jgi:hypothetical protein
MRAHMQTDKQPLLDTPVELVAIESDTGDYESVTCMIMDVAHGKVAGLK